MWPKMSVKLAAKDHIQEILCGIWLDAQVRSNLLSNPRLSHLALHFLCHGSCLVFVRRCLKPKFLQEKRCCNFTSCHLASRNSIGKPIENHYSHDILPYTFTKTESVNSVLAPNLGSSGFWWLFILVWSSVKIVRVLFVLPTTSKEQADKKFTLTLGVAGRLIWPAPRGFEL